MKTIIRPFLLVFIFICARAGAQVPVWNSYPGAEAVIFLDFDGHIVQGTSWNWNGPIHCGPSGLEAAAITEITHRIAEDYRPFRINITTDSSVFLSAALQKRIRIIFTTSSEWYGNSGGVAMLGSFTWGDDTPAFVFSALLGYDPKRIGEAGSHEAGHSLGLYHQVVFDSTCLQVAEYNPGQGSGEIGWAPIMGVGYYRNMTLWHYGPNYLGCNNNQDELQMISVLNNILFRTDDHSNDFKQATQVQVSQQSFNISGVIEKSDDSDFFKLNIRQDAQLVLNAIPFSVSQNNSGSNLDMKVSLFDKKKAFIAAYHPFDILNLVIDTFLHSGFYYLKVEGEGNEFAPAYASLGAYTLEGNLSNAGRGEWVLLNRQVKDGLHRLDWEIQSNDDVERQVIEYSFDSKNFNLLSEIPPEITHFIIHPKEEREVLYRVFIRYYGGREQYSNKVKVESSGGLEQPRIISNIVDGELQVRSRGIFEYLICDMNGTIQMKGKINPGFTSIRLPYLSSGIYVIRFLNGKDIHTEKFMKQ